MSPRTEHHEGNRDSKTVTFYKNGDRHFKGHVVAITPRRFRSLDVLLSELSRVTDLPQGVRYLLSLDNGTKVESLDQIHDGKAYVCSSSSHLKKIPYGSNQSLPHWGSRQRFELPKLAIGPGTHRNQHESKRRTPPPGRPLVNTNERAPGTVGTRAAMKPKIVTVIRNGHRPRVVVKLLLNKRTAQTLDQVLNDASDAIGLAGGRSIRRLFSANGQQITAVSELFLSENAVFIAAGSEKFRPEDIEGILEDLSQGSQQRHKKHSGNSGNERMYKQRDRKDSQREANPTEKMNISGQRKSEERLSHPKEVNNNVRAPKLPDIHQNSDHRNRVQEQTAHVSLKPVSPKARRQQSKQIHKDKKPERKHSSGSSSVKLPQIGNKALVTKSSEKAGKQERAKPGHQGDNNLSSQSVFGKSSEAENVNKTEPKEKAVVTEKVNRKVVLSKKVSEDAKTISNKENGQVNPDAVEYGTVRDKNVEDVYYIGKKIGDGNFAVVRECTHKITKKEFALKIIDKSKIRGKEKMIRDETSIMRRCRHENIVRLYEDFDAPTEIYLVMELIKGGDLFDAISSAVKFPEDVAKGYVSDTCQALAYLHKQRIVHRDLKPENLLVSRQ